MAQTEVKVRAQAVGGKFLGMGVNSTPSPTVTVLRNGSVVGTATFITGDSGVITPERMDANTGPICVTGQQGASGIYMPGTYYLSPSSETGPDSYAPVMLPLTSEKVTYTFQVKAYNNDLGQPDSITLVSYDMALDETTTEVVVPIPGLRVTDIAATRGGITAGIAMMCGCKITPLKWMPPPPPPAVEPYWPEYEFDLQWSYSGPSGTGDGVFFCTNPGQFTSQGLSLEPGKYTITIYASQNATGAPCNVQNNANKVQTTVTVS